MNPYFVCKRCGSEFDRKCNLKEHLFGSKNKPRKIPCLPKLQNIDVSVLQQEFNELKHYDKNGPYNCQVCGIEITSLVNLKKHETTCKENKKIEEVIQKRVHDELEKFKINSTQNNYFTNNITTNIVNNVSITILPFGNETYDHIPKEFMLQCFTELRNSMVTSFVEKVHFNDDAPGNKNIKILPKQAKDSISVYTSDNKWEVQDLNKTLNKLINNVHRKFMAYMIATPELLQKDIDTGNYTTWIHSFAYVPPIKDAFYAIRDDIKDLIKSKSKIL